MCSRERHRCQRRRAQTASLPDGKLAKAVPVEITIFATCRQSASTRWVGAANFARTADLTTFESELSRFWRSMLGAARCEQLAAGVFKSRFDSRASGLIHPVRARTGMRDQQSGASATFRRENLAFSAPNYPALLPSTPPTPTRWCRGASTSRRKPRG